MAAPVPPSSRSPATSTTSARPYILSATPHPLLHPAKGLYLCSSSTPPGGGAREGLDLLRSLADAAGLLLLAPASREYTWDLLVGRRYGPDLALIDRALEQMFSRYAVTPERVAVGGFSDGASYALSLGITNGNPFTHVLAFSPGFMAPAGQTGPPRIFISHGTRDGVLPIDSCSRRIVPQLERAGYDVHYREFDGEHTIAPEIALEAVSWFTRERVR